MCSGASAPDHACACRLGYSKSQLEIDYAGYLVKQAFDMGAADMASAGDPRVVCMNYAPGDCTAGECRPPAWKTSIQGLQERASGYRMSEGLSFLSPGIDMSFGGLVWYRPRHLTALEMQAVEVVRAATSFLQLVVVVWAAGTLTWTSVYLNSTSRISYSNRLTNDHWGCRTEVSGRTNTNRYRS